MKGLRVFCCIGIALSLGGAADSAGRYFALEPVIDSHERAVRPKVIDEGFEEIVASAQHGKYALEIYRAEVQMNEDNRLASIQLYRIVQNLARQQVILFAFLFMLFAVMLNRVAGSNQALQGDGPRPAGSARA